MNNTGNTRTSHCPWFVFLSDLPESLQEQSSIFTRVVLWRGCLHKVKVDSGWDDQQLFHDLRSNLFLQENGVSNMTYTKVGNCVYLIVQNVRTKRHPLVNPWAKLVEIFRIWQPFASTCEAGNVTENFRRIWRSLDLGDSGKLSRRNATTKLWQEGVFCKQGKIPCSELTRESKTSFTLSWCLWKSVIQQWTSKDLTKVGYIPNRRPPVTAGTSPRISNLNLQHDRKIHFVMGRSR